MSAPPTAEQIVAESVGRMMAFWGFRKNLGRIWAALYLSPAPLTQQDLCERLQLSAGAVSMALSELTRWGAIEKRGVPGDRHDFFVVDEDVWGSVSRVMAQREAREIEQLTDALRRAEGAIGADRAAAAADGDAEALAVAEFRARRVAELDQLAASGRELLRLVLGQERLPGGATPGATPEPSRRPLIPRAPEE